MSGSPSTGLIENLCSSVVRNRDNLFRARVSPGHILRPALNGNMLKGKLKVLRWKEVAY